MSVFASAFCFYFSTVVIRWSREVVAIDSAYFAFFRFLLGFMVVGAIMLVRRQRPAPKRYHFLIGRTLGNCIAVYCFYQAVRYTSVAEAMSGVRAVLTPATAERLAEDIESFGLSGAANERLWTYVPQ